MCRFSHFAAECESFGVYNRIAVCVDLASLTHNLSRVLVGNDLSVVPQITVNLSGDSCIDTISQIGNKKLVILSVAKDLDSLNEMAETRFFGFASE